MEASPIGAGFDGHVEGEIACIWTAPLSVANISTRDSFFALGGPSLLAMQAHREIKARLGVAGLAITDIFRHPVLGDLAEALRAKLGIGGGEIGVKPVAPHAAQPAPPPSPSVAHRPAPSATATVDSAAVVLADAMAQRREMHAARRRCRSG